jgi:hypothetical protein
MLDEQAQQIEGKLAADKVKEDNAAMDNED